VSVRRDDDDGGELQPVVHVRRHRQQDLPRLLRPRAERPGQFRVLEQQVLPPRRRRLGQLWARLRRKTPRNYSFTTEIHAKFKYNSGQTFTFHGDDDVWIFINGKLAVDLGGLHEDTPGSVNLDQKAAALGITPGNVYPLDLFNAERHSVNSDFSIVLNFQFQDCGYIIP
jgi:fibro-slime domain-containing protein